MQRREIIYGLSIACIGLAVLAAYVFRNDHGRLMRLKTKEKKVAATCCTPVEQRTLMPIS